MPHILPVSQFLMRKGARIWGLACLIIATLCASIAHAETISSFRLENGLEVVVIEDHRAPVVVQMIWYRAGAADEPAGKSGIAHFLEHLMFKGTEKVPGGEFSARVEALGGDDNAFTSWDYTAYYQRISAEHLELVMEMEADRMQGLILDEPVVLTEREVILEERAQRTDSDPGALLGEQMRASQFMNHRYGVPIIGWRHEIAQLSREDALQWYQTYYAPNNAILIIAGDVTPEQVKDLAQKHYGPLKPSDAIKPRLRPSEPPQLAERRLRFADARVSSPYVYRSYLAPERNPGDQKTAAALTIFAELLGGNGQTSALAQALHFDTQTAVWSAAYYSGDAIDNGTFSLLVVPAAGVSLEAAEKALDATLADFLAKGPSPEAFERVKRQIRAQDIYSRDDTADLARRYGEELALGLSIEDIESYREVLDQITLDEVMAAGKAVLARQNAVTGWLERPEVMTAPEEAASTPAAETSAPPSSPPPNDDQAAPSPLEAQP